VIIGEYSSRRSRGEYSPIITESECTHKSFVFFGTEFILISLSVTSTKRLAAILQISVLLYSPVGEYNCLITSNLTNQLRIYYCIFTCAKILKYGYTVLCRIYWCNCKFHSMDFTTFFQWLKRNTLRQASEKPFGSIDKVLYFFKNFTTGDDSFNLPQRLVLRQVSLFLYESCNLLLKIEISCINARLQKTTFGLEEIGS
jgi:hypothetical protein